MQADATRPARARDPHRMPDHRQAGGDRRRFPVHPGHLPQDQLPSRSDHVVEIDVCRSPTPMRRPNGSPTSFKARPASSRRKKKKTGSASTALTSKRPSCQQAGAKGSSRCRTRTRRRQRANPSTPAGASTRKTCAPPSSAPSGKRTGTSSRHSCASALVDHETILTRLTVVDEFYRPAAERASLVLATVLERGGKGMNVSAFLPVRRERPPCQGPRPMMLTSRRYQAQRGSGDAPSQT